MIDSEDLYIERTENLDDETIASVDQSRSSFGLDPTIPIENGQQLLPTKEKSNHPPTSVMVIDAIKSLKERNGSSLYAIKGFIAFQYKADAKKLAPFIKKFLKSAVAAGNLVQTKGQGANGSFKLPPTKSASAKRTTGKVKNTQASSDSSTNVDKQSNVLKTKTAMKTTKKKTEKTQKINEAKSSSTSPLVEKPKTKPRNDTAKSTSSRSMRSKPVKQTAATSRKSKFTVEKSAKILPIKAAKIPKSRNMKRVSAAAGARTGTKKTGTKSQSKIANFTDDIPTVKTKRTETKAN